jgi:hypothetical protein
VLGLGSAILLDMALVLGTTAEARTVDIAEIGGLRQCPLPLPVLRILYYFTVGIDSEFTDVAD